MVNKLRQKLINLVKKNDELTYRLKLVNMQLVKIKTKYIDDETYIKRQYKFRTGKEINLNKPLYYNEKIQWIKLNYRNPILKKLVDKYEVREYVKEKIGEDYLIPIYGVYNDINEVNFEDLPKKFVVKLTNGSGFNYICNNKDEKEIKKIKERFSKWIKIDFYALAREWAYKDVKNRILVEKYLEDTSKTELKDYKVFCFDGEPKFIQVDYCRFTNHKRNLYTTEWEYMPMKIEYESDPNEIIEKPDKLVEMLECSKKLSKGFPHVRVDFYYLDNKIYFGELTFYHGAGYLNFEPKSFEKELGELIKLK